MGTTVRIGIFEFNSNGENLSMGLCKKAPPQEKKDKKTDTNLENIDKNKIQKNTQDK